MTMETVLMLTTTTAFLMTSALFYVLANKPGAYVVSYSGSVFAAR